MVKEGGEKKGRGGAEKQNRRVTEKTRTNRMGSRRGRRKKKKKRKQRRSEAR